VKNVRACSWKQKIRSIMASRQKFTSIVPFELDHAMANISSQICTTFATTIRQRHRLRPEETDFLAEEFQYNPKPNRQKIQEIASDIDVSERTVQIWFQNRRAKLRRLQKESTESTPLASTAAARGTSLHDNKYSIRAAYGFPEWIQLRTVRCLPRSDWNEKVSSVEPAAVYADSSHKIENPQCSSETDTALHDTAPLLPSCEPQDSKHFQS
jgi:Homeodomain